MFNLNVLIMNVKKKKKKKKTSEVMVLFIPFKG